MDKTLTLWDIDGNLVNVYKYHTPTYQKAMEAVYGVRPSLEEIEENYGLPASEVVAEPIRKFGIDESVIQEGIGDVLSRYSEQLEEGIKASSEKIVLPGVSELLRKINSLGIPMGIVTGNIRKAGEAIINGSNLDGFFDPRINSYGDHASYRHEIVRDAINRTRRFSLIEESAQVYVFGDTPADVEAAKENDCISIAVIKNSNELDSSPGGESYSKRKEALKKSDPDFLFDDYTNLGEILVAMGIK